MKATYYGHSAIGINGDGIDILFDPFITPNKKAKDININLLNPDYIFLSHAHEDHVADMAAIQKKSKAEVVCIVETGPWVAEQGVPSEKITAINLGGSLKTSFGSAKMVYALHTNSTPEGNYAGLPVGYVLKINNKKIYFAGDTALTVEMQLLADEKLDWAFLPIGGFYTMDVQDAIRAAKLIDCKNIIGIHYNTFPPITIDEKEAIQKFADAGVNLHLLKIADTIEL
jgi:L-ascorbate metabolism protein UlaG (beta-lactamase superfamily)